MQFINTVPYLALFATLAISGCTSTSPANSKKALLKIQINEARLTNHTQLTDALGNKRACETQAIPLKWLGSFHPGQDGQEILVFRDNLTQNGWFGWKADQYVYHDAIVYGLNYSGSVLFINIMKPINTKTPFSWAKVPHAIDKEIQHLNKNDIKYHRISLRDTLGMDLVSGSAGGDKVTLESFSTNSKGELELIFKNHNQNKHLNLVVDLKSQKFLRGGVLSGQY